MTAAPYTLKSTLHLLFSLDTPVSRRAYVIAGLSLAALKYAIDASLVYGLTGRVWPPVAFLAPTLTAKNDFLGQASPERVHVALGLAALPFLWVGLTMSVRRAEDARRSPWLGTLFLVPVINYLTMLGLSLLPSRPSDAQPLPASTRGPASAFAKTKAALLGSLVGIGMMLVSVALLETYGAALFYLTPFVIGVISVHFLMRSHEVTFWGALAVAVEAVLVAGGAIFLLAAEGILCLAMAAPLALASGALGGFVAYHVARRRPREGASSPLFLLLVLPGYGALEARMAEPVLREVVTVVEIDAPPERVWENVVHFSELPPPVEPVFRAGIAYPVRAIIRGSGVGAVRRCQFSTGAFVEPITVWDPPHRLAFDVAEQPASMRELSIYGAIHAPHLEGSFRSHRGEFRLIPLPGGRTRLEGSTFYTLALFPESYWFLYSDYLLHKIHGRVLQHIARLSERASG